MPPSLAPKILSFLCLLWPKKTQPLEIKPSCPVPEEAPKVRLVGLRSTPSSAHSRDKSSRAGRRKVSITHVYNIKLKSKIVNI